MDFKKIKYITLVTFNIASLSLTTACDSRSHVQHSDLQGKLTATSHPSVPIRDCDPSADTKSNFPANHVVCRAAVKKQSFPNPNQSGL